MNNYCAAGCCFDPKSNCISRYCWDRDGIFCQELLKHITNKDIYDFFKDNHLFSMAKIFYSEKQSNEFLKSLKKPEFFSYCGLASCLRRELYLIDKLQKVGIEIQDIEKALEEKKVPIGSALEMIKFFEK